MRWTKELPKTPGWYWYRESGNEQGCMPWIDRMSGPVVVEVESQDGSLSVWVTHMDFTDPLNTDNFPGEWAGPIPPPADGA